MNDSRWYTYVALGLGAVLLIGFAAGFGLAGLRTAPAPAANAPTTGFATANLVVAFNPASGLDEILPGNLTLPVHTPIRFTVTSYDNGTNLVPGMYASTTGTFGGAESILRDGVTTTVRALPADAIGHTFTIMAMAGGSMPSGGMLNVVIPPAVSLSDPVTVIFTAEFNTTGTLTWICMAPCDPVSMQTPGLMTGSVVVE